MGTADIPDEVRALLEGPNYGHLSTLRRDGSPRNHVVWVWTDQDRVIVATHDCTPKAKDMRRDGRVALSVTDNGNPYRMAALRGRVVDVLPGDDYELMDRIADKYTSRPFPAREYGLVYFVIRVESAYQRTLDGFRHDPGEVASASS